MIQHPAILALIVASLLISCMLLIAGWHGITILRTWNLASSSERQVNLERRTYLVSVILGYSMAFQVLSLFLFIFTADSLHSQFVGAMCAAGVLNVNSFGYPTFVLKIVNALLAGTWLIINHVDSKGYDYPLIRVKYALLMVLIPLILVEGALQYAYFAGLKADLITSCCGSLFSADKRGMASDLAGLPPVPMMVAFAVTLVVTLSSGLMFRLRGTGGYLFTACSSLFFIVAAASLVSFISLYIYALPTHHCPFCILQKEYGYTGYFFYATLLGGGMSGLGVGALMPFRDTKSLVSVIQRVQGWLATSTLALYLLFSVTVFWSMITSVLRLVP
jgi:hypothetical protein